MPRVALLAEIGLPVISGEVTGMRIEAAVALGAVGVPFGRPGGRPIGAGDRRVGAGRRRATISRSRKGSADRGADAETNQACAPIAGAAPAPAAMPVTAAPTVSAPTVAGFSRSGEDEGAHAHHGGDREGLDNCSRH